MKKIIFSTMIASLLAFVGCQNEELVSDNSTDNSNGNGKKVTLTANIAGSTDSRVALTSEVDESGNPIIKVNWREYDEENPETFVVYNNEFEDGAEFTQEGNGNKFSTQHLLPVGETCAYYGKKYNVNDGVLSYDLSEQDGTLNEDYILMEAPINENSTSITFNHKTAILRVKFIDKNRNDFYQQRITSIVMNNVFTGSDTNTITIAKGIKDYYFIFLPINENYNSRHIFKFDVNYYNGEEHYEGKLTIPDNMSIEAGKLYTATIALSKPYVTFRVAEDKEQTLKLDQSGSLSYSTDNGKIWTKFSDSGNQATFGNGNDLLVRGEQASGYGPSTETSTNKISFTNPAVPVECFGDIRTLYNYKKYAKYSTSLSFFSFFEGCSNLVSAPELPATKLGSRCYKRMFKGCTSLKEAPELPATTLAQNCYESMFEGCESLTTAPNLPATTLTSECYASMFKDCTGLTTAPELPATTMSYRAYMSMFEGCTGLTTAPNLPATTLNASCYESMFAGCTSLETAPEQLPATQMKDKCYKMMFMGCTSLKTAPKLLATELNSYCFQSMFENCSSLVNAPELSASKLYNFCYPSMFKNCTSLKNVTMLAYQTTINVSLEKCFEDWLSGVAESGTIRIKDVYNTDGFKNYIPNTWEIFIVE